MTSGTFQGGYSAMFIASRKSPLKVGFSVFCTGVKANIVGRCLEGRSGLLSSPVNIIALESKEQIELNSSFSHNPHFSNVSNYFEGSVF